MSMGIAAKAGMSTLWRHRMSNKSSPMPSSTTLCSDSRADRYDASWPGEYA